MSHPLIVTLTPNPSIDRTVTLTGRLERGEVHRVSSVTSVAGGKGVNISRAALAAGIPTVAVFPAAAQDPFVLELTAARVDVRPVEVTGTVRVNLAITEPDGTTTKLNAPGSPVSPDLLETVGAELLTLAERASWVVLAGSLPPGAPVGWYAELVRALRRTPAKVAVDTSEGPLAALVDALPDAAPDLMKPNGDELASLTGTDSKALESDPARAAIAARQLVDQGVETVLVTLGGTGAVLVTADDALFGAAPAVNVRSTVGAGDSSLFGYVRGQVTGVPLADRLALAIAYGSAAASLPGTTIPRPEQVLPEAVRVSPLATSLEAR